MRKNMGRFAVLGMLPLVLAGRGLLWAPLEERSNPLDPKAESVPVVLRPMVDGTVLPLGIDPIALAVSNYQYSVIRFDVADLPATIKSALMTLQCNEVMYAQTVEVYPILQPWDEDTIGSDDVVSAGFLTTAPATSVYVDAIGSWDFDLKAVAASMPYGLALKGSATGSVRFYSSATAGQEPRLVVVGDN